MIYWNDKMRAKQSKTVRSFLAIEVDENLIPQILDVENEFKKTDTKVKYVPARNMHLTLKFFGNIDEDMIEDIGDAVERVIIRYNSFDLDIENCGSFPNQKVIKVIWLGLREGSPITQLQKDLDKEFKKLGFKKERNFISHLTIGRVKSPKNKNQIKDKIEEFRNIKIGRMTVKSLHLKKSTLTPDGPIYEDIRVFNLD